MQEKTVLVTLKGYHPGIMMHPMPEEVLDSLRTGNRLPVDKTTPPDEIAKGRRTLDPETGELGIPTSWLLGALRIAGRKVKNNGSQISTAYTTTLFSFLAIEDQFLPFISHSEMLTDKKRGVMGSGTKAVAVCIVRPCYREWELAVEITVDTEEIQLDTVKQLFEVAGKKIGVGSFRPTCNGPFGRFQVTGWEVQEALKAA